MTILCVDDERLALRMLVQSCTQINPDFTVKGFTNPLQALEYARNYPVNLLFMDIAMPGMNGMELAARIRVLHPKVNIIPVTAYPQYALEAFSLDCSGYLLKPFSMESLRHQLEVLRFAQEETDFVPKMPEKEQSRVRVQCFGNFEIFIDGQPLNFRYNKTKELIAFLVDRRGAMCSNALLAVTLWEDDENHTEYLKSLKKDLLDTLRYYHLENIITVARGKIGICVKQVDCDYYEYLQSGSSQQPREYMSQYTWAEGRFVAM